MVNILHGLAEWIHYQRLFGVYPSREATRASIGKRRRFKVGTKYDGGRLNRARECARRRRQIAKGMLRVSAR